MFVKYVIDPDTEKLKLSNILKVFRIFFKQTVFFWKNRHENVSKTVYHAYTQIVFNFDAVWSLLFCFVCVKSDVCRNCKVIVSTY